MLFYRIAKWLKCTGDLSPLAIGRQLRWQPGGHAARLLYCKMLQLSSRPAKGVQIDIIYIYTHISMAPHHTYGGDQNFLMSNMRMIKWYKMNSILEGVALHNITQDLSIVFLGCKFDGPEAEANLTMLVCLVKPPETPTLWSLSMNLLVVFFHGLLIW